MQTYIALLRGINVGGRNKLPMKELKEVLAELGLESVKTYIQSGNVVFESAVNTDCTELENRISQGIEQSHGFRPAVMVLTQNRFAQALEENPYPEAIEEPKTLHLYFLATAVDISDWSKFDALKKDSERYTVQNQVFYLHAPEGIGRSKLAARAEKLLGVPATARNWRSASKILELAQS